jgi:hypothetical protein
MKTLNLTLALFIAVVTVTGQAWANSVTFGDSNKYWGDNSSWTTTQKWATDVAMGGWNGNQIDVIGDPNITGGTAVFTSTGKLQSVSFNYYAPYDTWNMLAPGNLFINTLNSTGDTIWDYVVDTRGIAKAGSDPTEGINSFGVYNVTGNNISAQRGINDSSYVMSGNDVSGDWSGYIIRDNHPIEISTNLLTNSVGQATFSGFPGTTAPGSTPQGTHLMGTATYDFSRLGGLDLGGKNIILAWETTCANDVVYEQVNNPVPEPGTMMLFGFGMLGLAVYGKRRMNREA